VTPAARPGALASRAACLRLEKAGRGWLRLEVPGDEARQAQVEPVQRDGATRRVASAASQAPSRASVSNMKARSPLWTAA
jgi:hypothetical protein